MMIFVHGLLGNHLATWGMTPQLILDDATFREVDFCFLGYSRRIRNVDLFGGYLASVFRRVARGEYPFARKYRRVVLVGHSLGGVGVRAAVLELLRNDPETVSVVKECLLIAAPLFGLDNLRTFVTRASTLTLYALPVLEDLNTRGDVDRLRKEYDYEITTIHGCVSVPRSRLIWAMEDWVIAPRPSDYCPPCGDTQVVWPGSHTTCVKPDAPDHPFIEALRAAAH